MVVSPLQPRNVAGFRGTVRYASVNAHKNRVSGRARPEGCKGSKVKGRCAAEGEGGLGSSGGAERRMGQGLEAAIPETPIGERFCL